MRHYKSCLKKTIVIAVTLVFHFHFLQAQHKLDLNEQLPIDKDMKIGKLPNGLTYYIRKNTKPEKKVELRLVLNVGSILEDDDQQGLAHFCEHMAFNGSKHFKKNELVSFLQSIGLEFGGDLNAYTSFDQTVYILPIPLDKSGNLEKGFQVLEDWAHDCTYDNVEIDKERGVVLEESRLYKGFKERMSKKLDHKLFAGSLYAQRPTIGQDSILKSFSYETIKRFYRDWYRPNLMAVVVVGDIDVNQIEGLVKKHFLNLKNPENFRPRKIEQIAQRSKTEVLTIRDKEAPYSFINLFYPFYAVEPEKTVGDYKQFIVKNLLQTLLANRFDEIRQQENAPFAYAGGDVSSTVGNYELLLLEAVPIHDNIDKALTALIQEIEKIKKIGFTSSELEVAKKIHLSAYEKIYNERMKMESAHYAEEYINHFLHQEMIPGIENEYSYYKELSPTITLDDINHFISKITAHNHPLVMLVGSDKKEVVFPTDQEVIAILEQAKTQKITVSDEKEISKNLLKEKPVAGKIIHETKNKILETIDLTLSNHVTLTLKKTNFKNDEIKFIATRKGGASLTSADDKYVVLYLKSIMDQMGVGDFTPTGLKKMMAGKLASVSFALGETAESISGSSSVKDIEAMFQLLYLYVTQPRRDEKLFNVFKEQEIGTLDHIKDDPQTAFMDTLRSTLYAHSPLTPITIPNADKIKNINIDHVLKIYKEHFGNIDGYHFTIVGNINLDSLKPLIETYMASLPSTGKTPSWKDRGLRRINGQTTFVYKKGIEKKSLILEISYGSITYSSDFALKAEALQEVINIQLTEKLREEISGVYGSNIAIMVQKEPFEGFIVNLYIPCGPEKADTLLSAAHQLIQNLKEKGCSKKDLNKVKQLWKEQRKISLKENAFWLSRLNSIYWGDLTTKQFLDYEKRVDALTVKDIQDVARLIFDEKNKFTGILLPE